MIQTSYFQRGFFYMGISWGSSRILPSSLSFLAPLFLTQLAGLPALYTDVFDRLVPSQSPAFL